MILSKTIVALAASSLLAGVSPVLAQHRNGGDRGAARSGQSARSGGGSARGSSGSTRGSSVRPYSGSPRSYSSGSRSYAYGSSRGYSSGGRIYGGGSRGAVVIRGGGSYGGRYGVSSGRFYRPYYTFRPRVSLGFGLWVGYPVSYPYYYDDPYYYDPYYTPYGYSDPYAYPPARYPAYPSTYPAYPPPYPSSYPPQNPSNYPPTYSSNYPSQYPSNSPSQYPSNYPPQSTSRSPQYPSASGSVGVQRGQRSTNVGGVSFDITPDTAEVFVDGSFAGRVGEFTASARPLDLTPGHHRIEIRASGYRTLTFEENIVAGQVLPFQGTMEQ
jgi:hypothetical protein